MASEIFSAREGGVSSLNTSNAIGNASGRGNSSSESVYDKITRVSKQGNYEKIGNGRFNEIRYDEPVIRGDMERADSYLTVQEARKGLKDAQERLSKLPPVDDRTPLLSKVRLERSSLNTRIRDYRYAIRSYNVKGGSAAIRRLKKHGFTMKDINEYRNG